MDGKRPPFALSGQQPADLQGFGPRLFEKNALINKSKGVIATKKGNG